MERHKLIAVVPSLGDRMTECDIGLQPDPDGPWVRYEDYERVREALTNLIVGVEMVRDGLATAYSNTDPDGPARKLRGCVENDDLQLGYLLDRAREAQP